MQTIKICTHNGVFHADDVLSVTLLELFLDDCEFDITRTRDIKTKSDYNFIIDVGSEDHIGKDYIALDHHQPDSDFYPNNVKYAACGKVADYLCYNEYINSKLLNELRDTLLWPVEAQDNGQNIKNIGTNKLSWVVDMNPSWDSDSNGDKEFLECVELCKVIVSSIISRCKAKIEAMDTVCNIIKNTEGPIVVLDRFMPWSEAVIKYNETTDNKKLFFVYKSKSDDGYICKCVQREASKFGNIIDFPEEWAGKRDKELSDVSGIEGGIFCHSARFITSWKTKEQAILSAKKAIKIYLDNNFDR